MTPSRHARRRRRRYYRALAHEQRAHRPQARVAPAHRADDLYAKGIAWAAIVVLVLVALTLAATL
jgi:hypothetical protein